MLVLVLIVAVAVVVVVVAVSVVVGAHARAQAERPLWEQVHMPARAPQADGHTATRSQGAAIRSETR